MIEMPYAIGKVVHIIFQNPENFYKIMVIEVDETNTDYDADELTVTGTFGDIVEGDQYQFFGHMTSHPRYGDQMKVEKYERVKPDTTASLISFLSSDRFSGIGKKTAEKIVQAFPENTIDAILDNPDNLKGILTPKKAATFVATLQESQGTDRILAKLAEFGFGQLTALKIHDKYKQETLQLIQENPYQLVYDIQGIGFQTADRLARQLGYAEDSPERLQAALLYMVSEVSNSRGDTYVEARELIVSAIELLEQDALVEIDVDDITLQLNELLGRQSLQSVDTKIFDNTLYYAEQGIHKHLTRLMRGAKNKINLKEVLAIIETVQDELGIVYDDLQKQAIIAALENPVYLLSGGPGTGKTTVIKGILKVYAAYHNKPLDPHKYKKENPFPYVQVAPTGRAARRMMELTDLPARTIHSQLGLQPGATGFDNALEELQGSLLIVDEFSMVDTWLAHQLFKAVPHGMQVLIVGDADQLPSVGPGQVLADLMDVPEIPKIRLEKVFRQSSESTILDLAGEVRQGRLPADVTQRQPDRSFIQATAFDVPRLIEQIAQAWVSRGNEPFELQVLIPMYKGPAGIDNVNKKMQAILNPPDGGLEFKGRDAIFRIGDKVMNNVNLPEENVSNGDLGVIFDLKEAKYNESKQNEITVNFDGHHVIYPQSQWSYLNHAYAMSIHKSQGSEFATVIIPVVAAYERMLARNLLYTAITRAKQSLMLLGELPALQSAVAREGLDRSTWLKERFGVFDDSFENAHTNQVQPPIEEVKQAEKLDYLTEEAITTGAIDPMIGMNDLDFEIFKD
jgi:exodeoxyribonuclease V alpha subunit